jgi:hypothetical protein
MIMLGGQSRIGIVLGVPSDSDANLTKSDIPEFNLQLNVDKYVPHKSMRKEVMEEIRTFFNASYQVTVYVYLMRAVAKLQEC